MALPSTILAVGALLSLASCLLVLALYQSASPSLRAASFSVKLCVYYTLAVAAGVTVWVLPGGGAACSAQAMLAEFTELSSMLWADVVLLNMFLVVCRGSRVSWRYEALGSARARRPRDARDARQAPPRKHAASRVA